MENLLLQVKNAKTKTEKQELSAQIISLMPQFLKELGEIEQSYFRGLKNCIDSEGSKSGGEVLMFETDLHREYKYKKRLQDTILSTIKVLAMYTER